MVTCLTTPGLVNDSVEEMQVFDGILQSTHANELDYLHVLWVGLSERDN